MTNNDILRSIRYTFDYNNTQVVGIFYSAGLKVTGVQVSEWLKRDEDPDCEDLTDFELASFLNGFINEKRGKREGEQPVPEKYLTNNIILRKLKIALKLNDTEILDILECGEMKISKHELSALFRNPKQRQYRECNNQILRKFLNGLRKKVKG